VKVTALPLISPVNVEAVTVPSKVAAPVTSNVPGISTLLVHSTSLPFAAVCINCLAEPSCKLLTGSSVSFVVILFSIALVVAILVSSVVYHVSVLSIVSSPSDQALPNLSCASCVTYKFCKAFSFKSFALIAEPG